jgi:hypothetical protein
MRLLDSISISDYSRLSEELGDGLRVINARINAKEAAIIQEHVAGLLAVPAGVLSKLRTHGLARIQIGKGGVASFPGYEAYQSIQIPESPCGITWNEARGAYLPSRREILLGTGSHGYRETALHEIGHALGDLNGYESSYLLAREYAFQADGVFGRNRAFYPNGCKSARGRKEFFAESVSFAIINRAKALRLFGPEYAAFLLEEVLAP